MAGAGEGNFDEATGPRGDERMELIRLVIQLTREYLDLWARFPTATEIAAQIGVPR